MFFRAFSPAFPVSSLEIEFDAAERAVATSAIAVPTTIPVEIVSYPKIIEKTTAKIDSKHATTEITVDSSFDCARICDQYANPVEITPR